MPTITLNRQELIRIACDDYHLNPSGLRLLLLLLVTMTESYIVTLSQGELARLLGISVGATSVCFHRLVEQNILVKIPKSHLYTLTPEFASRITSP